jgi:lipopolysaccharide biosynthesis glycosyltransferase
MAIVNVAVATDSNYILGALATLASARISLQEDVVLNVFFLHNGLSLAEIEQVVRLLDRFKSETKIQFHEINLECFQGYPKFWEKSSLLTYARLLLPDLIDESVDRLIYLDVDLLIMSSLFDLATIKLGETGVGACIEQIAPSIRFDDPPVHIKGKVNSSAPYFNAGLLVLDLSKLRKNRLFEHCMNLLAQPYAQEFKFHDQSGLNYILNGNFTILPKVFNVQLHRKLFGPDHLINLLSSEQGNYHFLTSAKPWKSPSFFPPHQFYYILMDIIMPDWRQGLHWKRKTLSKQAYWNLSPVLVFYYKFLASLPSARATNYLKTAEYWKEIYQDFKTVARRKAQLLHLQANYRQKALSSFRH